MSDLTTKSPNRLIYEDSPYLLQHAYNPVEWYPWGKEAFLKASEEGKPIFLSIGYSACHWCHVMEREVFENEGLANILNEKFVSIKVDREERPDIDKYFQHVHHIITRRSGGWPTSIFLTPDAKPFFAATYIPPKERGGTMGFGEIAELLYKKLKHAPHEVYGVAENIERVAKATSKRVGGEIDFDVLEALKKGVRKEFDETDGGIMGEPKFPHAALLELMVESKEKELVDTATHTLKCMAKGGMYDLVDGGFCRYSVDSFWLVPHFEKMAYDNGLLIETYAKAYGATKDEFFLKIAKESANFMLEKMSENSLFYSASDADSEGEEGRYFVYSWGEALEALGEKGVENGEKTLRALGFSKIGNFERSNIARNEDFTSGEDITKALEALKELRKERVYPFIDKKIICSWNCMVISALFALSKYDEMYLAVAKNSLASLLKALYKEGRLYHCFVSPNAPKAGPFLEDYAFLAKAFWDGYIACDEEGYLKEAEKFAKGAKELFYKGGVWSMSVGEFETEAEANDSSYSSAIGVLCSLYKNLGGEFADVCKQTLNTYSPELKTYTLYYASLTKAHLA